LIAKVMWLAFALFNLILISINVLQPFFGGTLCVSPFTLSCSIDTQTLAALQQARELLVEAGFFGDKSPDRMCAELQALAGKRALTTREASMLLAVVREIQGHFRRAR